MQCYQHQAKIRLETTCRISLGGVQARREVNCFVLPLFIEVRALSKLTTFSTSMIAIVVVVHSADIEKVYQ